MSAPTVAEIHGESENHAYFIRIPYDLDDALECGKLTPCMYLVMIKLYRWADWSTGVVRKVSADRLVWATNGAYKKRTFQLALHYLDKARYISSGCVQGRNGFYPVTINNYLALSGAQAGSVLSPCKLKDWRDSDKISCTDNCEADREAKGEADCEAIAPTTRVLPENLPESLARDFRREKTDDDRCAILETSQGKPTDSVVLSDAEIYREFKAVYDRLRQEYKAYQDFEPKFFHDPNDPRAAGLLFKGSTQKYAVNPVWEAMPQGKDFDNDLCTTAEHRHAAADLYRAIGSDATLAKWEYFLINDDHTATQRVPEFDEATCQPTGKFVTIEVDRAWLLHDFVLEHGVSTSDPTNATSNGKR
jgi:hypothetical protein